MNGFPFRASFEEEERRIKKVYEKVGNTLSFLSIRKDAYSFLLSFFLLPKAQQLKLQSNNHTGKQHSTGLQAYKLTILPLLLLLLDLM